MKSILFVITSLTSGGAERALVNLANVLSMSDFEVNIKLLNKDNFYRNQLNKNISILDNTIEEEILFSGFLESIKIALKHKKFFLLTIKLYNTLISFLFNLIKKSSNQINWNRISKRIRVNPRIYDIGVGFLQGTSSYYAIDKIIATKKILWVHNDYIKSKLNAKFDEKFIERADTVVSVSNHVEETVMLKFKDSIKESVIIKNIMDVKDIINKSNEEIDIDKNSINLLTIGRLHPQKGYDFLLKVAKKLKSDKYNFVWYIIGKGRLESKILSKIKKYGLGDYVKLIGVKENPYKYIKMCDIYVQPSRYEGFGIVVQEAKILNKPIVVTNCPSMVDQIVDGKNGLISQISDKDIYVKIKLLIDNPELRTQLSDNLKEYNYDYKSEISNIISFFKESKVEREEN